MRDGVPRSGGVGAIGRPGCMGPLPLDTLRARSAALRQVVVVAALLFFWAVCNPYFEIDHSSLIYSGRMLADLDPAGVGRDSMYRFDGQSGFTVFTTLNRFLVVSTGLASATLTISIASILAAFIGAAALARSIARGRIRILAIVYAAALPACYGGYKLFSYAETAATPRPFAEALVLCGLAALVSGRTGWAAIAMLGAALLHPILALPGVLLLAGWLVAEDRRWAIPLLACIAIGLCVCALHLPLSERLVTMIDPEWKAILEGRDPHLFPSLWPDGWRGRAAARIVTLIVAASLTKGPVRRIFLLTLAIGISGFAVSYLVNERLPIVLLVQAQTWRTMWLMFAIAPMAAAICTVELWAYGGARRVALALLALSWIFADHDQIAIMSACAAAAFYFCVDCEHYRMTRRSTLAVVIVASVFAMIGMVWTEWDIQHVTAGVPVGSAGEAWRVLALEWDYTPLAAIAAVLFGMKRDMSTIAIAILALCETLLLGMTWDQRSERTRAFDAGLAMPELSRTVGNRPGEVFWAGGVQESWQWLGRANWISPIQGAGIVFSRPLAMLYRDRAARATAAGLDDGSLLKPYDGPRSARRPFEAEKLIAFCAASDAPAWIVVPRDAAHPLPGVLAPTTWTLIVPRLDFDELGSTPTGWRWVPQIELAACAKPIGRESRDAGKD